jgi:ABC-2 type transport system ATP-binding protein
MSQSAIWVSHLDKSYGSVRAVRDLSMEVQHGEIFGLLGSNGAGKTTTIRMILDLIKPDAGEILVLGSPMREATKRRIGYLPEERGLYRDMKAMDALLFLARLKGLRASEARSRAETYLREVDLWDARDLKVEALSRGMQQKLQFVAAAVHEPELIIVDEPFSGLDPVNTQVIKELVYRMCRQGVAIVMSTHQMHQVEEMCQRILLIDKGKTMLYGEVEEIRDRFSTNCVEVSLQGDVQSVPGVEHLQRRNGGYRMRLEAGKAPEEVLLSLVNMPNVRVQRFERVQTSLEEIFVQVVGHGVENGDQQTSVVCA